MFVKYQFVYIQMLLDRAYLASLSLLPLLF
jgi:hypothetical protein